jgi:hypothetical protein
MGSRKLSSSRTCFSSIDMSVFRHQYALSGNSPVHLTNFLHYNKINIPFSNFMFRSCYFRRLVFLVQFVSSENIRLLLLLNKDLTYFILFFIVTLWSGRVCPANATPRYESVSRYAGPLNNTILANIN